ncbi:MAG TPA: hypothetical protein VJ770_04180, partial [Stellaceae bacterium]|nr:hypothetical protein [Stellaceae bacterium]
MRQRGRRRDLGGLAVALALALILVQCEKPAPSSPRAAKGTMPIPALLDPAHVHDRRLVSVPGLQRFFAALGAIEHKRATRPLRILQIGDSHTANDAFSSRLRESLQARFGAAGRGWLPAGIPFRYYRPRLVTVTAAGWRQFGAREAGPELPLGLDAAAAASERPGAVMTLESSEAPGFDRLGLEFVARPDGPLVSVQIDRQPPIRIPTAAAEIRAQRVAIPA